MIYYRVCAIEFGGLFSEMYATPNKNVAQIVYKDLEEQFPEGKFIVDEYYVSDD